MTAEHRLERRSRLLASAITARVEALRDSIASPGERPPFTEHKTEKEAFAWWREHFNDEYGQRVLERMQPNRVAELRLWLSGMIEAERAGFEALPESWQIIPGAKIGFPTRGGEV